MQETNDKIEIMNQPVQAGSQREKSFVSEDGQVQLSFVKVPSVPTRRSRHNRRLLLKIYYVDE